MKSKVIYPGTFDPITLGHLEIINRAIKIFSRIIIGIAANPNKNPLFNLDERISMVCEVTAHLPNVEVVGFSNLIVDFAKSQNVTILIHGLRSILDLEHKLQLIKMNNNLSPTIENIFLLASENFSFVSSSLVKEVALLNGDLKRFLPILVHKKLLEKITH